MVKIYASIAVAWLILMGWAWAGVGFIQAINVGAPTYFGIGDIVSGALVYYSVGSCYSNATTGTTGVVETQSAGGSFLTAGSPSTTFGCSHGVHSVTAGSPLATTCTGICDTFIGYDQSGALSCNNGTAAAQCVFQEQFVGNRLHRPQVSTSIAPNGTPCEHYNGYRTGLTPPFPQTLNNVTNTYAAYPTNGFAVSEPYTVMALMSSDGNQGAGTSGGPGANNLEQDAYPNLGFFTNDTNPLARIDIINRNTFTSTPWYSGSINVLYSIVGVFNEAGVGHGGTPSSLLCVNGSCNPINLGGTSVPWQGLSWGNGSGGWGGNFCEAAIWSGDKSSQAFAIWQNQQTRFGGF